MDGPRDYHTIGKLLTKITHPWAGPSQQEVPVRNMVLPPKTKQENLGEAKRGRCPTFQSPSCWNPPWLEIHAPSGRTLRQTMGQERWLARDKLETNSIIRTWDCEPHGRVVLLSSLTPCSPPRRPFPIESLAFSAHVSPQTIHFQVLDKGPHLGPGRGPLSSNNIKSSNPDREKQISYYITYT